MMIRTYKLNRKGKSGIGYAEPDKSKPSWLKNKLDKDRAKAVDPSDLIDDRSYDEVSVMEMNRMFIRWTRARWAGSKSITNRRRRRPCAAAATAMCRRKIVPANIDEENPSAPILSGLLVQADEGVSHPVVDLIDVVYRNLPWFSVDDVIGDIIIISRWFESSSRKNQQQSQDTSRKLQYIQTQATAHPVVSYNEPAVAIHPVASFAYPVDIESSRKKADVVESYNSDARYPVAVFEDSAEAQSKAIYAKAVPLKNVDERTSVREVVKPESCCRTEKKISRRQQQRENESEVKLSITIRERA
ncbi:putative receptor-like protein kinase [Dorcoceras hygrometricum]|uniref:Putative receptor-like protein kinase n=1 Tax=Dorcoceras hygrometricum TaxID=472368 RepID=A0A2Z7AUJ8_9LAMI|nr:putative receptor-like protein kinase [Dorcoceras hygrometricum]